MNTKHLVVTGSSSGIGRALAEHYLSLGWRVTGIDKVAGEESSFGQIELIRVDLSSSDGVAIIEDMVARGTIPQANCLILNAGISCTGPFLSRSWREQEKVIDLNLSSTLLVSAIALRENLVKDGGCVAFVSSMSRFLSYPGASVYAATKDGVTSWANSVRSSFKENNITVLTIFPGPTRTPHAERYSPKKSKASKRMKPEKLAQMIASSIDNRRNFLIPGMGNKLASALGILCPTIGEALMKKAVFKPLKEEINQLSR